MRRESGKRVIGSRNFHEKLIWRFLQALTANRQSLRAK